MTPKKATGAKAPSAFDTPMRSERLSDKVTAQIQQMIRSNELQAGDKLPPERELCERMGVSRTVIREAVRSLAAKGLLDVRAGGGTVVLAPSPSLVSEMMTMMLRGRARPGGANARDPVLFSHVQEVRRHLEVEIAGMAAERRTDDDLAEMQRHLEQMKASEHTPELWAQSDVAFHAVIAKASHNPLYPVLLGSIADMLMEVRLTGIRLRGTPNRALRHHRIILERITAKDGPGARQAMLDHLSESEDTYRKARAAAAREK